MNENNGIFKYLKVKDNSNSLYYPVNIDYAIENKKGTRIYLVNVSFYISKYKLSFINQIKHFLLLNS